MKKNIWLLFVSIFLIFTPFTSAYPIEGEKIAAALEQISPFMNLNPTDYTIQFDQKKAHEYGISSEYIQIGKDYEAFHNQIMPAIRQQGIYGAKIDRSALAKFEPFFLFVAETGMMHQKTSTTTGIDTTGTVPLVQVIRQKSVTQNSRRKNSLTDVCGGSREHPHMCPAWISSGISRTSRSLIEGYLRGSGYHNTYWPGCGSGAYSCPEDFTKWTSAYSCPNGVFRTQARLTGGSTSWSYRTQGPEPNPEIRDYGWPVWWWGPYVTWWHLSYC